MSLSLKVHDFHNVCRLCLDSQNLQSIFQEKYLKLISSLTQIEIQEGDCFPENICKDCVQQLENIFYFVDICKSTNITLTEIISDTKLEAQVEEQKNCIAELTYSEDDSYNYPDAMFISESYNAADKSEKVHNPLKLPTKSIEKLLEIVDEEKIRPGILDKQEFVKGKAIKGKRKFLCNYCGKNYTRKNGLDRHIMSHTGIKPFECKECGKCYITKDTLKTHILIHAGIKHYKCKICQKSFIQSSHLNYHMRRHAGEKPHTCSFCGKGFLSTYHLERHKLMHTGVKPFKCDLCDKHFVRSTTLRDHLLLHTGERPFQCQHCGKQFNRKQTLTNHVNLVHIEEGRHVINNYFIEENITKTECI